MKYVFKEQIPIENMNTEQQQNIVGDRDSEALLQAAERIDTLVALDVPSRGVIGKLYAIARNKSDAPLCLQAARRLTESFLDKETVFIVSGWYDRPVVISKIDETDGSVGDCLLSSI